MHDYCSLAGFPMWACNISHNICIHITIRQCTEYYTDQQKQLAIIATTTEIINCISTTAE